MEIIKEFISKKNKVFLMGKGSEKAVCKKFNDKNSYYKEKSFYQSISKNKAINMPMLIEYNDDKKNILLEYIEGKTLLEMLEECEENQNTDKILAFLKKLIYWLRDFHNLEYTKEKKLSFFDINFRNFIVDKKENIYGFDFESLEEGSLTDDIIKVFAMLINYTPVNSDFKINLSNQLKEYAIKVFDYSLSELNVLIATETANIIKRRAP
jgi:serine/threonine protein kinase